MQAARKRVLIYSLSALLTGGLLYVGFLYEAEADSMTLLSSVDIQIRLVSGMPEKDQQGNAIQSRVQMLRDIRTNLKLVEARLPDFAPAREYRAFLTYLEGDYRGAADHYRTARGMDECSEEMWDSLVINEARMLRLAGDLERALQVLTDSMDRLQGATRGVAGLNQARILEKMGRTEQAVEIADGVGRRGAEDPMAAMEAGRLLEDWHRIDEAEAAYRAASEGDLVGNYYRARLKVRIGDVDRSMRLLELAVSAAPSRVRKLVARDSQDWEVVAGDKRFASLVGSEAPASPRK